MGERRLSAILAGGNHLTATGTFAATNPLRYRGYCYDTETGLYYLQSRYYDPTTARFLNADTFASTGQGILGNNMFAYCGNNPILYADDTGKFPWAVLAGAVLGALTAVVGGAISGDSISTIVGTALVQAVIGAVIAAVPELAPVFLGYDIYDLILEGIYSGMSINETSIHIAALLFSFLTFPETNDPLVDTAVAATFGVSKDTTIGAIDNAICFAREYRHPAAVTYVIISTLAAGAMGGGCIGAVRKFFGFGGEKDLWQRI